MAIEDEVDVFWVIIGTILVFWMHAGFSLLEAGSIREKNVQNILFKNVLNVVVTTLTWWIWGYALAFGSTGNSKGFIGGAEAKGWAGHQLTGAMEIAFWAFQWAFAATAVTIISGGMAERANCIGYLVMIIWFQVIIYPVITHWVWSPNGWLLQRGYQDFAGSSVVHMVGGFASMIGCYFLGRRKGDLESHSIVSVVLGTFILWMGWYGFNACSTLGITGSNTQVAARVIMNTTIAASTGGITLLAWFYFTRGKFLVQELMNGILVGLVSITANCNAVTSWAAFCIGLIGPVFYVAGQMFLEYMDIDDAIGAFPVHGMAGVWGIIATGFFDMTNGLFYTTVTLNPNSLQAGIHLIGWQFLGMFAIIAWTVILMAMCIYGLKMAGILRVDVDTEMLGLDNAYHKQNIVKRQ